MKRYKVPECSENLRSSPSLWVNKRFLIKIVIISISCFISACNSSCDCNYCQSESHRQLLDKFFSLTILYIAAIFHFANWLKLWLWSRYLFKLQFVVIFKQQNIHIRARKLFLVPFRTNFDDTVCRLESPRWEISRRYLHFYASRPQSMLSRIFFELRQKNPFNPCGGGSGLNFPLPKIRVKP